MNDGSNVLAGWRRIAGSYCNTDAHTACCLLWTAMCRPFWLTWTYLPSVSPLPRRRSGGRRCHAVLVADRVAAQSRPLSRGRSGGRASPRFSGGQHRRAVPASARHHPEGEEKEEHHEEGAGLLLIHDHPEKELLRHNHPEEDLRGSEIVAEEDVGMPEVRWSFIVSKEEVGRYHQLWLASLFSSGTTSIASTDVSSLEVAAKKDAGQAEVAVVFVSPRLKLTVVSTHFQSHCYLTKSCDRFTFIQQVSATSRSILGKELWRQEKDGRQCKEESHAPRRNKEHGDSSREIEEAEVVC